MTGNRNGISLPIRSTFGLLVTLACFASAANANEFILDKPGNPEGTLLVRATPDVLHVTAHPHTPRQQEFLYERFRPGDTDDHLAYCGAAGSTYLRWPLNLRTPMLRLITDGDWHPLPHRIRRRPPPDPVPPPQKMTVKVSNPPLSTVTVELFNPCHHDLMVTVVDRRDPTVRRRPRRIPAGGMILQQIARDPGHLERTVLVAHTGETIRVFTETAVDPQPLYDVMVFEHTPVSQYVDRTGKDMLMPLAFRPPSTTFGERSLGVFSLPAGPALGNGSVINVFGEATVRTKPGLVSRF